MPSNKPALSLVEVMVAVSLISIILSALAVNMLYTQRTISNTRLRAKALDQANSCLDRFRNLNDSLVWWKFFERLYKNCGGNNNDYYLTNTTPDSNSDAGEHYYSTVNCTYANTIPAYNSLNQPAGFCSDNPDGDTNISPNCPTSLTPLNVTNDIICGEMPTNDDFQYMGEYSVHVVTDRNTSNQSATVEVKVQYPDYNGNLREVMVSQQFKQDSGEVKY